MDKINKWLHSCQHSFLSKGGSLTLLNATLSVSNQPIYSLSLYYVPAKVVEDIDKCFRNFLWSGYRGSKLSHVMKWDNLNKPLEDEGWGSLILNGKIRRPPCKMDMAFSQGCSSENYD